jgi:DNA (cytosine-5)-methyltransferase 1
MSWLFSRALVAEYLGENFSDGEQCAPLSGKPIPQAYCAPDKMTAFSKLSRFGMTYAPLTESRGEELLTLYLAAFRVPTFPQQEKEQELMEKPLECGEKWRGSFTKYDPDTSLWRTHQCSLLGDLEEFSETWPQWGLMRNGECWEQRTLEHRIRGTGFGLSPNGVDSFHTPNTTGLDGGSNSRKALKKRLLPTPVSIDSGSGRFNTSIGSTVQRPTLALMARKNLWPTPRAQEPGRTTMGYGRGLAELVEGKKQRIPKIVQNWPTPTAHNAKETNAPSEANRNTPTLAAQAGGSLNPMWVEWLMGWPLGWTDLKPLETDKCHFVPQQHGNC